MVNIIKRILKWYLLIVLTKIALSLFINNPSIFSDEFFYFKMGETIMHGNSLIVHGFPAIQYPPLYSIVTSLAHLFSSQLLAYKLVQIINAFLSSLLIFPAYYLAKEFLNEKDSLLIAVFVSLLSPFFLTSNYIMAENLFYPLSLLAILLIYHSIKKDSSLLFALTGFIIALI